MYFIFESWLIFSRKNKADASITENGESVEIHCYI